MYPACSALTSHLLVAVALFLVVVPTCMFRGSWLCWVLQLGSNVLCLLHGDHHVDELQPAWQHIWNTRRQHCCVVHPGKWPTPHRRVHRRAHGLQTFPHNCCLCLRHNHHTVARVGASSGVPVRVELHRVLPAEADRVGRCWRRHGACAPTQHPGTALPLPPRFPRVLSMTHYPNAFL